ncbi:MAG: SCO family protein [Rhodospirillales bacterium]|nr:SCO family protein [Rhodospirillales bacterium]
MNDRRKFIAGLSGAALTPLLVEPATSASLPIAGEQICTDRGTLLPVSDDQNQFPEMPVVTQSGEALKLYSGLVNNRVVVMNFMSIANEAAYPITTRVAAIVQRLGDRVGRDVTVISITADPANDTPERLAAFAKRFNAPAGWYFVRADIEAATTLSRRLYRMERDLSQPFTVDLIHYGNAKVGAWGSFPATIQSEDAVERIASVIGKPVPPGPFRKAGPRPLDAAGPTWHHRIVTAL